MPTCDDPRVHAGDRGLSGPESPLPVTVAVVNYNTRDLLARCLRSLAGEAVAETVVVDNASSDGSARLVADQFPDARLMANASNVGYAAAVNQSLRAARFPFVLVLNADTEVRPGAIGLLSAHLQANRRAAVSAPFIEDLLGRHQPSCFPFPGTRGWLLENAPLSQVTRRLPQLRRRSVSFQPGLGSRPVPWVLGAAMLLRRDAVLALGGFEEGYFMYYEEVDLCQRLAQAGWETHYVPRATIMHVGGGSTSRIPRSMRIRRFQSAMEYYHRNFRGLRWWFWSGLVRLALAAEAVRDAVAAPTAGSPVLRDSRRRDLWRAVAFDGWRRSAPRSDARGQP